MTYHNIKCKANYELPTTTPLGKWVFSLSFGLQFICQKYGFHQLINAQRCKYEANSWGKKTNIKGSWVFPLNFKAIESKKAGGLESMKERVTLIVTLLLKIVII
jgi:hypothetical protein